ncbi:hypothetical protein JTP67_35915, partial [Streptomyces sp. S12]|nr:hypothetical protein [Streptomyces sp. S12]
MVAPAAQLGGPRTPVTRLGGLPDGVPQGQQLALDPLQIGEHWVVRQHVAAAQVHQLQTARHDVLQPP